jgi:protein tyrosine/serine phosphatase
LKITFSAIKNLTNIFSTIDQNKLSFRTKYKISKLLKATKDEEEFYNSKFIEIITSFCELDEQGNPIIKDNNYIIKKDCIEECGVKMNELNTLEVDLPDIKFTPEELERTSLTIDQIMLIVDFIEE